MADNFIHLCHMGFAGFRICGEPTTQWPLVNIDRSISFHFRWFGQGVNKLNLLFLQSWFSPVTLVRNAAAEVSQEVCFTELLHMLAAQAIMGYECIGDRNDVDAIDRMLPQTCTP